MKIMILTSSPNKDGLTETCGQAAKKIIEQNKAEAVMVRLNDLQISACRACNDGFGSCNKTAACQTIDDFQGVQKLFGEADGYIIITPVYCGEMSESLKTFFDRLRRCEAFAKAGKSKLQEKPYLALAAAGGSGNGTVSCLSSMERILNMMKASRFELLGITKKNKDYMLKALEAAVEMMLKQKHQ